MRARYFAAAALIALASCGGGAGETGDQARPTPSSSVEPTAPADGVLIHFGDATVAAEVVSTQEGRQLGLMHRRSLGADDGMLFLFRGSNEGGFWMKNTVIPLSIAYMRQKAPGSYVVLVMRDMQPCRRDPCPSYDPGTSYDAALEVNQGWLDRNEVLPGSPADVEGRLPTPS